MNLLKALTRTGGGSGGGRGDTPRRRRGITKPLAALAVAALATLGLGASALAGGSAPNAETQRPSEITRTRAQLNGTVEPEGSETSCSFEYGTTKGVLSKTAPCAFPPGSRPIAVPEYAAVEGLAPSTTYYYRVHATNVNGEVNGEELELTTLPTLPRANTEDARELHKTSALLTGFVTPNGSKVTECYFEYAEKEGGAPQTADCEEEVGEGSEPSDPVFVKARLSGLKESTAYTFRLYARNAEGPDKGGREGFKTLPSEPFAKTEPARLVENTAATLTGFVTPNDAMVEECYFEYGPRLSERSETYEDRANCETFPGGSGEAPEAVSARVTGLAEGHTYGFRLVAKNIFGRDIGSGYSFTTRPAGPKVLVQQARDVTARSAELAGEVDPEGGSVTECYFEYGTTPAFGGIASCTGSPGDGDSYVKVTAIASGLSPDTHYLVRLVAVNDYGEGHGSNPRADFTTANGGEAPTVSGLKPSHGPAAGDSNVKVVGTHFEGPTSVYFGGVEAKIEHESVDAIEVIAPPGAAAVDVTVDTEAGSSTITHSDVYSYGKPEITSLTPNSGPMTGGTEVTVTGNGFEPGRGTTFVFGKTAASEVECSSNTSCVVIAPSVGKAKTVKVQAIVAGKASPNKNDAFTYRSG